jgi:hypothetical protein
VEIVVLRPPAWLPGLPGKPHELSYLVPARFVNLAEAGARRWG